MAILTILWAFILTIWFSNCYCFWRFMIFWSAFFVTDFSILDFTVPSVIIQWFILIIYAVTQTDGIGCIKFSTIAVVFKVFHICFITILAKIVLFTATKWPDRAWYGSDIFRERSSCLVNTITILSTWILFITELNKLWMGSIETRILII